ncbi:MAG: hypothetical protein H7Y20_08090 [Bryobacteraceae bacterium]|nr:hypothetical protein [Bryobacteraceae bacterium]
MLNQYATPRSGETPGTEDQDFDQVSRVAPVGAVAEGVTEAFRSDATPPFPQMLGQLFGNSGNGLKAGVLNMLISAVGPQVLSSVLAKYASGTQITGGQISPDQAQQIPPAAVQEMAEQAKQNDPDIMTRMGQIYAEHPGLVKTLGAAALGVAMSHLARQKRGIF